MCTASGNWPNYPTRFVYEAIKDNEMDYEHALALARHYARDQRALSRMIERWMENRTTVEMQYPGSLTIAAGLMQAVLEMVDYVSLAGAFTDDLIESQYKRSF